MPRNGAVYIKQEKTLRDKCKLPMEKWLNRKYAEIKRKTLKYTNAAGLQKNM